MGDISETKKTEMSPKELKKLRQELWVIFPFFIFAVYIFLGSFRYKLAARTVPMLIGIATAILTGMRLFHIIFPKSKIGQFKEAGLAGEFDSIKDEIAEEKLKGKYEEVPSKEITFRDEGKAFLALIGCFVAFLLFGYLVALFFVIVGTSYYYGYKEKLKIFISLVSMYLLCYLVLYKLLGAPADFGILLTPILESLRWI
jgi:hypothetical protein